MKKKILLNLNKRKDSMLQDTYLQFTIIIIIIIIIIDNNNNSSS